MSDERHKFIEVIGTVVVPQDADEARQEEARRSAFQAARRNAEALADEAGVRLGDVVHIAEVAEEGETIRTTVRCRVRFSLEAKTERKGTGFRVE